MVIGIGIDIVEIERLERAMGSHGDRLRDRIFTSGEIEYCLMTARSGERFATRFAAKEAARKALGGAVPLTALSWHDIEVVVSDEGTPQLQFHGRAADLLSRLGVNRAHVSLSHSQDQAIAFVIIEKM